jgi:ABC-type xylose transport system permease subunit
MVKSLNYKALGLNREKAASAGIVIALREGRRVHKNREIRHQTFAKENVNMLWTILVVLLVLWLLGLLGGIGGSLIHLLLVVALIVLVVNLLTGRRTV